jgi:hypothetical protein
MQQQLGTYGDSANIGGMGPRAKAIRAGVFVTVAVSRPAVADPAPTPPASAEPTHEATPVIPTATRNQPTVPQAPAVEEPRHTNERSSSGIIAFDGPIFFTVGYIGSFLGGGSPTNGHGVEASLIAYVNRGSDQGIGVGLGTVFQYQQYDSPESHGRWATGFEVTFPIGGLELLYAHRNGIDDDVLDTTHGIALGPYLSLLGVLNLAGRFVIPVSPLDERGYGGEYGVTLGVKLPLPIGGHFWTGSFGRPCTVGAQTLSAELVRDEAPAPGASDAPAMLDPLTLQFGELDPVTRASLLSFWSHIAEEEHASVAAFHRLSLTLLALGAPAPLLARSALAACDETRHAELARTVAERLGSCRFKFAPFPSGLAANIEQTPVELALSALQDGCLGEAASARILTQAALECEALELARALTQVAEEERAHAELAWAIVEYALTLDPHEVGPALIAWSSSCSPAHFAPNGWLLPRGFGAIDPDDERAHACAVRSEAILRLNRCLSRGAA